ncbi:MAG: YggT family protein [Deltaproteobacteria bacterium]|nr:YggT family protein [Deltaproteobacteria bacterium]MBI2210746.1 YggT family protein [Deltaproteobacteria bacterium]MBI2348470.1 YggT family protein [Deltaproteobacteria bacterium]MBI2538421.1 YggT family protein [Deltaproteobacteria bacterium]MBI2992130.1 YggT family protein [Deltaproteobacteria bacterium]
MFVVANFLIALAQVVDYLLWAYMWIVVARAVISWVNPDPYNPIVRFLHSVTDPLFYRIRRILPLYAGGIDFSPIVVFIAIIFLQRFLVQSLYDLARSLRFME